MSQAELARPCARSAEWLSEIASARAAIKPAVATQSEFVLGVEAKTWLGIASLYRFLQDREARESQPQPHSAWMNTDSAEELANRGAIASPVFNDRAITERVLFLDVASVDARVAMHRSEHPFSCHSTRLARHLVLRYPLTRLDTLVQTS